MRGWLQKKGPLKNLSVWRRRYCVLSRHTKKLSYYEDETCAVLAGVCDLHEAVRVGEAAVEIPGFGIGTALCLAISPHAQLLVRAH